MITTIPFEQHRSRYEQWFERHKAIFEPEVKARNTFAIAETRDPAKLIP